jgi:hypothetical protein
MGCSGSQNDDHLRGGPSSLHTGTTKLDAAGAQAAVLPLIYIKRKGRLQ